MPFTVRSKILSSEESGLKYASKLDQMKNSDDEGHSSDSSQYSGLEDDSSDDESDNSQEDRDDDNREAKDRTLDTLENNDEYYVDSSDEEDLRNTVGNIPIEWYKDFPHIGYNWDGEKIMKPLQGDQLDEFLKKMEDPNYWKTVKDKMTGQDVILSHEDLSLIQRIQRGKYPDESFNAYEPFEDIFSHETMVHPVTNQQEHKRSFIPSKVEKEKVARMVHAIKMGWIKPRVMKKDDTPKYYMLWENDDQAEMNKRMQHHIPAPKMKLPGHEESYNPPPEYLFTQKEEEDFNEKEPEERKINFIPKKYSCLRHVPAYSDYIKEKFERCLDLYLCPRQRKMRVNVDPEDLIPKLPKPKDLQPFPTTQALVYVGHRDAVRCITTEPLGQFLASGSSDCTVRIWEVLTGRCMKTFEFDAPVKTLAWCPSKTISLLAVAEGKNIHLINPAVGDRLKTNDTDNILKALPDSTTSDKKSPVLWTAASEKEQARGQRIIITHEKDVKQVTWHGKGDYFATVVTDAGNRAVIIHHLSTKSSQVPFRKVQGDVQCVLFHPTRPYFFVASQRHVRVYNLLKQQLTKKLLTNCKWLSSMDIHPQGDNLITGSYDTKLSWFDLDLSVKPYKAIRHHKKAIRQVSYHKHYPLFASASDDGSVIVCHGMVYSDLLQNPLIVPVKVLRGHQITNDLGVLDCCFHPFHPWIFSSGSDGTIRLFT